MKSFNLSMKEKLSAIVQQAMSRAGVLPRCPWRPNLGTKLWLSDRGLLMGWPVMKATDLGPDLHYKMADGTMFKGMGWCSDIHGFVATRVLRPKRRPTTNTPDSFIVWVPEETATKALVLGCLP